MPRILGHGKYIIKGEVHTGMIKLGFPMISVYRDKGIVLENKGQIIFQGETCIGGGAGIAVGEKGCLSFGDKFSCLTRGKIICYHKVSFEKIVRLGWNAFVCDTDLHSMKSPDGASHTKGYGEIKIGEEVWVGSFCKIFKNTSIPPRCTVASGTILNKPLVCDPYSLIYSGGGIKTKYTGKYRDINDDQIIYE